MSHNVVVGVYFCEVGSKVRNAETVVNVHHLMRFTWVESVREGRVRVGKRHMSVTTPVGASRGPLLSSVHPVLLVLYVEDGPHKQPLR